MEIRKIFSVFFVAIAVTGLGVASQQDEMETIEIVAKLQRQLESQKISERDQAEKDLMAMGPSALDYLEPATDETTTDAQERLARIRNALETVAVAAASNASKVTLVGEMTVGDALKKIKAETGNNVVTEFEGLLETKVTLESDNVEFWRTMDDLQEKSKMKIDAYGGEPGTLKLVPLEVQNPVQNAKTTPASMPTDYSKIFQVQATSVVSSMNLGSSAQSYTDVGLVVRWEPRLRPISVDVPMSSVKVIDEFGDAHQIGNPEQIAYGMVQPEIPEVEFTLRLPRVDRQIEMLNSISAKIDAVLPGRIETFRFKNLAELKTGKKMRKAGATVSYDGTRKNEDIWGVTISLSFEEEHNALESHQGWVFQNTVFLQNDQGEKEQPIGSETIQQDNSRVTIQYFFLNEPGNRSLVYKTPAAIVKMPVEITLKKIPMP